MAFSSPAYVLLLLSMWALARISARPAYAYLLGSVVFFLAASWLDIEVLLVALAANWLMVRLLPRNRVRIAVAVIFNIGLLAFFKYAGLFRSGGATGSYIDTALPLGISFYVFQVLAYHIDVVRGVSREASSLKSFVLFKTFFPQLIAGPIVRAPQLLPQIERLFQRRGRNLRLVSYGLCLCVMGLAKKVVLADSLAPHVDAVFAESPDSVFQAWAAAVLFGFQIYFDFSGYSDIAIGSAYLLGIRLPTNFLAPYLSANPRDFWQRWHMTLSRWIRDYLYIPLGGSRGTEVRNAVVLVATMAIAGLWHGAGLTFVAWGTGWGIYMMVARVSGRLVRVPAAPAWLLHSAVVTILWVFFRAPNLGAALSYLGAMVGRGGAGIMPAVGLGSGVDDAAPAYAVMIGIAALYGLHWLEGRMQGRASVLLRLRAWNGPFQWGLLGGLCLLLVLFPTYAANPFIYFRF